MKYVNTSTGKPPYASDYMLARMGPLERSLYAPIAPTRPPWYDSTTHKIEEGLPENVKGEWLQVWNIVPRDKAEIEAMEAAEVEARKAQALQLLAESDYRATADRWSMMPHEQQMAWADYREALREVVRGNKAEIPEAP